MTTTNDDLIPTGHAARLLGISQQRLRKMDDKLKPIIGANGRRMYDARDVDRLAGERDAKRGAP